MKKIAFIWCLLLTGILPTVFRADGQEHVGPLRYNPVLHNELSKQRVVKKTTAALLTLPFFEDFTGYSAYPDSNKWMDNEVYINNTMCVSPVSRGAATFDDLNQSGFPYDTLNNLDFEYADSLTSRPIDLSSNVAGDSIYLSFFYQPQGNGFYPLQGDSLILYLKNRYGDFIKVWSVPGYSSAPLSVPPFVQVMIPVTDSLYFHNSFQFRFVNIAALDWADAIWNVDYIRMDINRSITDTAVNDIAFSSDPTFLLNDYTSMPYRQFYSNVPGESALQYTDSVHNDYTVSQSISYGFSAVALNTGAILQPPTIAGTTFLSPASIQQLTFPAYSTTIPLSSVGIHDKVVFENTYFIPPTTATGPSANDTIVKDQVFDNYLAYDDGTAEKSYYLNLFPTLDARIAIEYHLNQPDTMRGMAIYFGRQIPLADYKTFSIIVYSALAGVAGSFVEDTLYHQDYLTPAYVDTINHFFVYKFDTPLPLPAGTFYAGTIQYPESGDDSLYIGLDVNRAGSNHAYYNVLETWEPSLISGALMMRPLVGQDILSSYAVKVHNVDKKSSWQVSPNPAKDELQFTFEEGGSAGYTITNIQGQPVMKGTILSGRTINIASLQSGVYFVNMNTNGIAGTPKKIIKL